MPATKIVKRTGEVVVFDRARIRNAVAKVIRAVGTEIDPGRLDVVVDRVIAEVDERFTDFFPNVENIQDIVEKHLVREGFYEIAKAYILYRADRQRERDAKKTEAIERARLGRLTVQTRDGRVVLFNLKKCEESVKRLATDLGLDLPIDCVVQEADAHDLRRHPDHADRAVAGAGRRRLHRAGSGLQLPRARACSSKPCSKR